MDRPNGGLFLQVAIRTCLDRSTPAANSSRATTAATAAAATPSAATTTAKTDLLLFPLERLCCGFDVCWACLGDNLLLLA